MWWYTMPRQKGAHCFCMIHDTMQGIKLLIHKSPFCQTYQQNHNVDWSFYTLKILFEDSKKFWPISACSDCAGWHELKLFTDVLSPLFTEHGWFQCRMPFSTELKSFHVITAHSDLYRFSHLWPITRKGTLSELLDKIIKTGTKQAQADSVR